MLGGKCLPRAGHGIAAEWSAMRGAKRGCAAEGDTAQGLEGLENAVLTGLTPWPWSGAACSFPQPKLSFAAFCKGFIPVMK